MDQIIFTPHVLQSIYADTKTMTEFKKKLKFNGKHIGSKSKL